MTLPIFYSFRRCPYAMRARLALNYSGIELEHREILLKNKPAAMLAASPKGTVPVLVLADGRVLEESLDIMLWALENSDKDHWYQGLNIEDQQKIDQWISDNDEQFKPWLDKYKYSVGYPEHPESYYREQAETFLERLNQRLSDHTFLLGTNESLADNALFPFIRQFANVDRAWFDQADYPHLQRWLSHFLESPRFIEIMKKWPLWENCT